MIISSHLTVSAMEGFPEGDGNRYELIEGELHVTTQPHNQRALRPPSPFMGEGAGG
jgi:hypothetical protein